MRLKVYQAPNIGAAMAMVRDELGPDALILANRSVDGGVELTAAHEQLPSEAPPALPAAPDPVALTVAPQVNLFTGEIARSGTLRWHGVPTTLAARLSKGDLAAAVAAAITFGQLPRRLDDAPLMVAGPPGAGKTLTIARLATQLKLSGQTALVITCDGRRAGAAEQLAAFTRLLGLTLIVADTAQQLARAVARRTAGEPVLIDMPGLDPFEAEDQAFIRDCQAAVHATIALVLPAGLDPADAEDLATGFKDLGATLLIATRLDQSRRLGGIMAAADTGLALTEAGISAAVADGLTPMTPAFVAERLSYVRPTPKDGPITLTPPPALARLARSRGEPPRSQS